VAAFAAALPAGARVLDAGAGEGQYARYFAGRRYCGVDLAVGDASWNYGRLDALADLTALPFRQGTFQAAVHIVTIEHLREPADVVRQAGARLREHGLIAITMPNVRGTASLLSASRWPYYDFGAYGHIHHLSPRHVRELVRRAGFETVYEETRGSVDLRDLPAMYGWTAPSKNGAWVCDKASGALARLAQPLGFGNTLFTVARKVPGGSDRTLGEPAGWRNGARG